jgi:hypothetical protein
MASEHPSWCVATRCEAVLGRAGYHSTEPITIPRPRRGTSARLTSARLAVRLYGDGGTDPLVELVVGDHDDGHRCRVDLSVQQTQALDVALGRVLDALDATPLPPHDGYKNGTRNDRD